MIDTSAIREGEEDICHFTGIRLRVNGSGNLIPTFYGLDNVQSQQLAPIVMSANPGLQPFRLANFIGQRAFLKLETTQIDEIFRINRIIVYAKPIWTQYPGI